MNISIRKYFQTFPRTRALMFLYHWGLIFLILTTYCFPAFGTIENQQLAPNSSLLLDEMFMRLNQTGCLVRNPPPEHYFVTDKDGRQIWEIWVKQTSVADARHPKTNEDFSFVKHLSNGMLLSGVLDGMGGNFFGKYASPIAGKYIQENLSLALSPLRNPTREDIKKTMRNVVQNSSKKIKSFNKFLAFLYEELLKDPTLNGSKAWSALQTKFPVNWTAEEQKLIRKIIQEDILLNEDEQIAEQQNEEEILGKFIKTELIPERARHTILIINQILQSKAIRLDYSLFPRDLISTLHFGSPNEILDTLIPKIQEKVAELSQKDATMFGMNDPRWFFFEDSWPFEFRKMVLTRLKEILPCGSTLTFSVTVPGKDGRLAIFTGNVGDSRTDFIPGNTPGSPLISVTLDHPPSNPMTRDITLNDMISDPKLSESLRKQQFLDELQVPPPPESQERRLFDHRNEIEEFLPRTSDFFITEVHIDESDMKSPDSILFMHSSDGIIDSLSHQMRRKICRYFGDNVSELSCTLVLKAHGEGNGFRGKRDDCTSLTVLIKYIGNPPQDARTELMGNIQRSA